MSSAEAQRVYAQAGMQPREPAQEGFAQQFDLGNPDAAMSSYQKLMHQHTKQQFEMVASSRRRSSGTEAVASLPKERSNGSVSSTAS